MLAAKVCAPSHLTKLVSLCSPRSSLTSKYFSTHSKHGNSVASTSPDRQPLKPTKTTKLDRERGDRSCEELYNVSAATFLSHNDLKSYLFHHKQSPTKAVMALFPDHQWHIWNFKKAPDNIWSDQRNVHRYAEWLREKVLKFKYLEDWYKVDNAVFKKNGGATLLNYYDNSFSKLLLSAYPDHEWQEWRFKRIYPGYWSVLKNQLKFMNFLSKKLSIRSMDEWYTKLKHRHFRQYHGTTLLSKYNASVSALLSKVYPEHAWEAWRFERTQEVLANEENLMKFVESIRVDFQIKQNEDWYRLSDRQMRKYSAYTQVRKYGGLAAILERALNTPDHIVFDRTKYEQANRDAMQKHLFNTVVKLYPEGVLEYYDVPEALQQSLGVSVDAFDVFVPSQKLAFEYQGSQHYKLRDNQVVHHSTQQQKTKDEAKRQVCEQAGIRLIEVPYWWDGTEASLASLITPKTVCSVRDIVSDRLVSVEEK